MTDSRPPGAERLLAVWGGGSCIVISLVLELGLLLPLPDAQAAQIKESKGVLWERGIMLLFGTEAAGTIVGVFRKKKQREGYDDDTPFDPPPGDLPPGDGGWLSSVIESQPAPPDENIALLMRQGYSYDESIQIMQQNKRRSGGE